MLKQQIGKQKGVDLSVVASRPEILTRDFSTSLYGINQTTLISIHVSSYRSKLLYTGPCVWTKPHPLNYDLHLLQVENCSNNWEPLKGFSQYKIDMFIQSAGNKIVVMAETWWQRIFTKTKLFLFWVRFTTWSTQARLFWYITLVHINLTEAEYEVSTGY